MGLCKVMKECKRGGIRNRRLRGARIKRPTQLAHTERKIVPRGSIWREKRGRDSAAALRAVNKGSAKWPLLLLEKWGANRSAASRGSTTVAPLSFKTTARDRRHSSIARTLPQTVAEEERDVMEDTKADQLAFLASTTVCQKMPCAFLYATQ